MPKPERALTGPGQAGTLPQGTYRYALSVDELVAAGLTQDDAENNAGVVD